MASYIEELTVRAGRCPAVNFSSSGTLGDWQAFHVPFLPPMPSSATGKIRVLVSASDDEVNASDHQAVPVVIVGEISNMGFTAWVRNSDVSSGWSGLVWFAIAEQPEVLSNGSSQTPPLIRFGSTQPQHFQYTGRRGDWRRWEIRHGTNAGFSGIPCSIVSPTNQNVRVHASSAVGIVAGETIDGFNLAARSADVGPGACSFCYLSVLIGGGKASGKQMVDSGQVSPRNFSATGLSGDWQVWSVAFAEPFLVPPVVLLTADNANGTLNSYARAAVGTAFDTTTNGFTLAARNSDVMGGPAGFTWLAVGYAI